MPIVYMLLFFPLLPATLVPMAKAGPARKWIGTASSIIIIALSIAFCFCFLKRPLEIGLAGFHIGPLMMAIEIMMALYVIFVGVKHKKILAPIFSVATVGVLLWLEYTQGIETGVTMKIDRLSVLMVLIIGVIGGLICMFSGYYMQGYHKHHPEYKDRSGLFFMILYTFIFAMFGLALSNDLLWMFFFWEATSLFSFILIGYTRTDEAINNAFNALAYNTGGGLSFAIGIAILWKQCGIADIQSLLALEGQSAWMLAGVFMLGIAGLTKSAQLPFSKWLLGAMVAPTPTSAMLHSSTMVKAGVYLFIRLSPMLRANQAGMTFTVIGGFTFLMAALIAVSQRDAKRVLAYSTISNLGLIVACAGIGTAESIWAAIMLMIFHAIAKSLMFLTVGVTENVIGSRDLEGMDGLYNISGTLTMLFVIGIAGMFLAPFGMLISKWAAMKALIDSGNMMIVSLVAFGSSATLFFWTKWLGKLMGRLSSVNTEKPEIMSGERIPLYALALMVVTVCLGYPLISSYIITPYLENNAFAAPISPLSRLDNTLALTMMGMLFIIPVVLIPIYRRNRVRRSSVYLSGLNTGDDQSFYGSMGAIRRVENKNWYLTGIFGEDVLLRDSIMLLWVILLAGLAILAYSVFMA